MSQVPSEIDFEKLIVWAQDTYSEASYSHFKPFFEPGGSATLVAVSKWAEGLFPATWNKTNIHNMVPDWVYDYKVAKDQNQFIYASATIKGLPSTVECFKELKKTYFFKKHELSVLSPGYDDPHAEILKKNKVHFAGSLPFSDVVKNIARSGSMLYVNDFPETFAISPVMAEILGCNVFVYCTKGIGALNETLNTPLVTDNKEQFWNSLMEFGKNSNSMPKVKANDYRVSTIIKKWLDLVT